MEPIIIGGIKFAIPEGFKHVLWADVKEGDVVYTIGRHKGKPHAYGPYKVYNIYYRRIENDSPNFIGSRTFDENVESLLIKE